MTSSHAPLPRPSTDPATDLDRRAHEPSMEEILASIRKIIADENGTGPSTRPPQGPVAQQPAAAPSAPVAPPAPPVAPYAPAVAVAPVVTAPVAPMTAPVTSLRAELRPSQDSISAAMYAQPVAPVAPQPAPVVEAPVAEEPVAMEWAEMEEDVYESDVEDEAFAEGEGASDDVLSEQTRASVASAFQALSTTVAMQADPAMIERAVREMLRPMLRQWLDDNLPVMVERMVRAEIERVARGGR